MQYTVETGSGVMIYIPIFMKTSSGIQTLMGGGGYTDTRVAWRSHKPTFIPPPPPNEESVLIIISVKES
jgi:hypothetical protein